MKYFSLIFSADIFCSSSIILVCPGRSRLSQWVVHKVQRIRAFGVFNGFSVFRWEGAWLMFMLITFFYSPAGLQKMYFYTCIFTVLYVSKIYFPIWKVELTADLSLALQVCTFAIFKSTQCIYLYCLSIHPTPRIPYSYYYYSYYYYVKWRYLRNRAW